MANNLRHQQAREVDTENEGSRHTEEEDHVAAGSSADVQKPARSRDEASDRKESQGPSAKDAGRQKSDKEMTAESDVNTAPTPAEEETMNEIGPDEVMLVDSEWQSVQPTSPGAESIPGSRPSASCRQTLRPRSRIAKRTAGPEVHRPGPHSKRPSQSAALRQP